MVQLMRRDVLELLKGWCDLVCKENTRNRNKKYDECLQECLEMVIRMAEENIKRFGLTNHSVYYDEEEYLEEDEDYYEEEEEIPTVFEPFSRDYSVLYYSGVGPATAFYLNVNAVLRKYGITIPVDNRFYNEVMNEITTQGTIEDAVKRAMRKRGWLST